MKSFVLILTVSFLFWSLANSLDSVYNSHRFKGKSHGGKTVPHVPNNTNFTNFTLPIAPITGPSAAICYEKITNITMKLGKVQIHPPFPTAKDKISIKFEVTSYEHIKTGLFNAKFWKHNETIPRSQRIYLSYVNMALCSIVHCPLKPAETYVLHYQLDMDTAMESGVHKAEIQIINEVCVEVAFYVKDVKKKIIDKPITGDTHTLG